MSNSKIKIIRWAGFLPLTILVSIVVLYFIFFFDKHLKWALETVGSSVNGARVEISSLKTSFLKGDFLAQKIEFASEESPMKNWIEMDKIHFQFSLGTLIKKKVLISDMAVEGIHYGTQRKTSGAIAKKPSKPSAFGAMFTKVMDELVSKEVKNNPLASLSSLSNLNVEQRIKTVQSTPQALKEIEKVSSELSQFQGKWEGQIKTLPNAETVKGYEQKITQITQTKIENPTQVADLVKQGQNLKNEVESDIKKVETVHNEAQNEFNKYQQIPSTLQKTIESDIENYKSLLKLPSFDPKDISKNILAPKFTQMVTKYIPYINMVRQKMKKKNQGPPPPERFKGSDFHFVSERMLPTFTLSRIAISSDLSSQTNRGKVKGELLNITSDPPLLGLPTEVKLGADFPASNIHGATLHALIDHTQDKHKEKVEFNLKSFGVSDFSLVDSPDVTLGLQKGLGHLNLTAQFTEEQFDIRLLTELSQTQYLFKLKDETANQLLSGVLDDLRQFNFKGRIFGSLSNPNVEIQSDLGERLAKAISSQFSKKVAEAETLLRKHLMDQIEKPKKELLSKVDQTQNQVLSPIKNRLNELTNFKKSVEQRIAEVQKKATSVFEQQAKDKLKDVIPGGLPKVNIPGF